MSAIFFGGVPLRIIIAWHQHKMTLVVSSAIYSEYKMVHEVLREKYDNLDAADILDIVQNKAVFVKPVKLHEQVCGDRDDDKFIACALAARAIVVSGDKKLIACSGYRGLVVMTPRHYVSKYLA
jgi:putative PIN family toxin of toxin-antitoxin system